MSPTCSNSDLAGRNALSTAALTICFSPPAARLRAAPRDLDPPPVHQRADRAEGGLHLVGTAARVAELRVADGVPLVGGRVGQHRFEPAPRRPLDLALPLLRPTRLPNPLDEIVAQALQLLEADDPPHRLARHGVLAGRGLAGMRRELPLEPLDLAPQGSAHIRLVHLRRLDRRTLAGAAGVEHAGEVARVDAALDRRLGGARGELLDPRLPRRVGGDERALPLPGSDEALVLEPPVDGASGVGVHTGAGGELADAGQSRPRL